QSGMPQVMPDKMLVPERRHDLIPVRGVPQDRRRDPAAPRTGEQARRLVVAQDVESSADQFTRLFNDRHFPSPLALSALVDQPARTRRGLTANRPDPGFP